MMSGFQSFGNCPISKHVHNQCAKLVLPSCEPKTKQREAMARITPHPEPQDVCALPHVRDDSLLVVPFPRIFENSQKKSKAGADQENVSKMAGVAEENPGFLQFCSNFGGVLVILGHIFFF